MQGFRTSDHSVEFRVGRLPVSVLSRAWSRGLFGINDSNVVHASTFRLPPTKKTLTLTVHDLLWRKFPDTYTDAARTWHEHALSSALDRGRAFVVPSQETRTDLISLGVPGDVIEVIAHGADHLPAPDFTGFERKLNEAGVNGQFLLSVGTREPRKNLMRIDAAAKAAADTLGEQIPLVIAGPSGWLETELSNATVLDSLTLPELSAAYERARLFIYAPLAEGFGLPPLEAMYLGTPTIASSIPSVVTGARIVDPNNIEDIAHAVVELWSNDDARKELAMRGQQYASAFTWKASAEAHWRFWEAHT